MPLAEEDRITLETDLGEDCIVRCNQEDASQILRNLMENAIKYNVTGGEVLVTTRRQGARVPLSVADTGVGIPEADMPRIFERFYRVDKARSWAAGGTGLGLSIVRDAVRHHGGTITVQARQPAGVVFTVILPAWREEESGDERKMRRGLALGPLPLRAGGLRGNAKGTEYAVYYCNQAAGEEAALVAEKRVLPPDTEPVEGLNLLLSPPQSENLTMAIPSGVTLRKWTLYNGLLTVDFSSGYGVPPALT